MIVKPFWYANIASSSASAPHELYSRFQTPPDSIRREFAQRAISVFLPSAEKGSLPIADMRTLFDYTTPKMLETYAPTPCQGKTLVTFASGSESCKLYPNGLVLHSKMKVDRDAMTLGDAVFREIGKTSDLICPVLMVREPDAETPLISTVPHDGIGYDVYATPYFEGHPPYATKTDLSLIGRGLGDLNNAFSHLPAHMRKAIQDNSKKEIQRLLAGAKYICANQRWFNDFCRSAVDRETCAALTHEAATFCKAVEMQNNGQWAPNHANMILGDALISTDGKKMILMDPERIADGWNLRALDIGQAVGRIALEAATPRQEDEYPTYAFEKILWLLEGFKNSNHSPMTVGGLSEAARFAAATKVFSMASRPALTPELATPEKMSNMNRFAKVFEGVTNAFKMG